METGKLLNEQAAVAVSRAVYLSLTGVQSPEIAAGKEILEKSCVCEFVVHSVVHGRTMSCPSCELFVWLEQYPVSQDLNSAAGYFGHTRSGETM